MNLVYFSSISVFFCFHEKHGLKKEKRKKKDFFKFFLFDLLRLNKNEDHDTLHSSSYPQSTTRYPLHPTTLKQIIQIGNLFIIKKKDLFDKIRLQEITFQSKEFAFKEVSSMSRRFLLDSHVRFRFSFSQIFFHFFEGQ